MEAPEEFTGSNDHTLIAKGKRTKRQRPSSPSGAPVTSSSSSGGGGGGGGGGDFYSSIPSPTTSGEISTSTEEDQDMANCLILLAQGVFPRQVEEEEEEEVVGRFEKFSSARFTDMVAATATTTTTTEKARFYVYECKTCNRTFPSFQALGGHRASHKRPKAIVDEKRVLPVVAVSLSPDEDEKEEVEEEEEEGQFNKFSPPLSLPIAIKASSVNNKPKVHECSVCGLEFSSGQALGGHMRRHRAPLNTRIAMVVDTSSVESQKESDKPPRNILSLDLNLPAPPEDDDDHHHHQMDSSKFQFTPNKQHLVFSSPALVDCHY